MVKKVSAFDVLKIMSERNLDIRGFNIWDNLLQVGRGKKHGRIVLSIDDATAQQILAKSMGYEGAKNLRGMLLVCDDEQYSQIQKELENAETK